MGYILLPDNNSPTSPNVEQLLTCHIRGAHTWSEHQTSPVSSFMCLWGLSGIFALLLFSPAAGLQQSAKQNAACYWPTAVFHRITYKQSLSTDWQYCECMDIWYVFRKLKVSLLKTLIMNSFKLTLLYNLKHSL